MRVSVALLLLLAFTGYLHAQTRIDAAMTVDSVERKYIMSVPTGPAPAGGYPLVFVFHGTSQDGEKFWKDSQWKETCEAETFIAVFPTSLTYCFDDEGQQRTATKWHNGELEEIACTGQYLKNDVSFVRAMIDSVATRFPIDRRRMYATGFSNGAAIRLPRLASGVYIADIVSGGSRTAKAVAIR